MVIYGFADIISIHVKRERIKKYTLILKFALFEMIFLSFALRYWIENFLAFTLTISIEILDLYYSKHSKFRNKRTDFFFAFSIIIIFFILLSCCLLLFILYKLAHKIKRRRLLKPFV